MIKITLKEYKELRDKIKEYRELLGDYNFLLYLYRTLQDEIVVKDDKIKKKIGFGERNI